MNVFFILTIQKKTSKPNSCRYKKNISQNTTEIVFFVLFQKYIFLFFILTKKIIYMTENIYIYICFSKIYYCFKFISFFSRQTKNKKIVRKKIKKIKSGQIWPNLAKTAIWPDLARFGQISFFFKFCGKKSKQFLVEILMGKNLDIFKFFLWWKLSRWEKKPGRSMDFFPAKRNGKRNENPDGKNSGHSSQFFFGGNYPGGKKNLEDLRIFFP